jgi:hypothetical protein
VALVPAVELTALGELQQLAARRSAAARMMTFLNIATRDVIPATTLEMLTVFLM